MTDENRFTNEAYVHVTLADGGRVVAEGTTNAVGKFEASLPRGLYTVTAEKDGFCTVVARAAINDQSGNDVRVVALRPIHVHGTLTFQGHAYPDATLRLEDPQRPTCSVTVTTGAEGRFSADGVSPNAKVSPMALRGRQSLVVQAEGRSLSSNVPLPITVMNEVFPLDVRVTDEKGTVLPDAEIALIPPAANKPGRTEETKGTGRVRFLAAKPQTYRLVATVYSNDGSRVVWKDVFVDLEHSETTMVVEPLSRDVRISGSIHDDLGRPASGIKVFASTVRAVTPTDDVYARPGELPREHASTTTDAEGRFVLRGLRPDQIYRVTTADHEADQEQSFVCAGSENVTLEYRPYRSQTPHTLRGRLVDSSNRPISNAKMSGAGKVDSNGYFTVTGADWVTATGYVRMWLGVKDPNAPENVDLGSVVLPRARTIHGHVLRFDGKPAVGVSGVLTAPDPVDEGSRSFFNGFEVCRDGTFTVPEFANGRVLVRVFDGDAGVGSTEIPSHESEVDLHLAPPASVMGTVFDSQGQPGPDVSVSVNCANGPHRTTTTDKQGHFSLRGLLGDCVVRAPGAILPTGRIDVPGVAVSLRPGESKQIELRARPPAVPPEQTVDLRVYHAFASHYRSSHLFRGDVPPPPNAESWMDFEPGSIPEHDQARETQDNVWVFRIGNDEWDLLEPGTYTLFVLEPGIGAAKPLRQVLHLTKPGLTIVYPQLGEHPLTCGSGAN